MSGNSTASNSTSASCAEGFFGFLNCATTLNQSAVSGETGGYTIIAAIVGALAGFGFQLLAFLFLRLRLSRIYVPRSYLVPERQRIPPPPGGIIGWIYPLFTTKNLTLIQKCGLDAYFFLRYLRMLLKIFFPMAVLVLPILLPINKTGGGPGVSIDKYSINNVAGEDANRRLWAHLVLAVLSIFWIFYVVYQELRGYIRVRQAYLTSPQHRIRASATTVLVTGIPRKWLTFEALSGLFDVYPGGIRNIWVNRNYGELAKKVNERDKVARQLESAETNLIRLCLKKHEGAERKRLKAEGQKRKTKAEKKRDQAEDDATAQKMAEGKGVSAGEQHDVPQGMQDALDEEQRQHEDLQHRANKNPFAAVGHGLGVVGQGLGSVGKGISKLGGKVVGDFDNSVHMAGENLDKATDAANTGGIGAGFLDDESLYNVPIADLAAANDAVSGPQSGSPRIKNPANEGTNQFNQRPAFGTKQLPPQQLHPFTASEVPSIYVNRPSAESKPKEEMEIEEPCTTKKQIRLLSVFRNNDSGLAVPSPRPHVAEDGDEFPLQSKENRVSAGSDTKSAAKPTILSRLTLRKAEREEKPNIEYPAAFQDELDADQDGEPRWARYIKPKERATKRLPVWPWFFALPLVGEKVDTIYYLRRELARLNMEIEADQNDKDRFPLMSSAFIQFNHQIAAHMCCQSLSHHVPLQMAPRTVEISPNDVIWENMAMTWWQRYLRSFLVLVICIGLMILWAFPVAFTSVLNKISAAANVIPWLSWVLTLPKVAISIFQGLVPPLLLLIILLLVPMIFRALIQQQGVPTRTLRELGLQKWYFAFLFIQVFLIVSITNGITQFIQAIATNPTGIPEALAQNLPSAANYFYSYLAVQALGNSAGALLQTGTLFFWFVWASMFDKTARDKWQRQTGLSTVEWGSFFPLFTNFAVIGIIYSIIAPLILVFMIFIFSLFWIVYRFNVLYVNASTGDTGGRLFPVAINQLFTGLYFLELCLIGLFFTLTNDSFPQAIIMIVMLVATVAYQVLLNMAFEPFYQYLPITLEDEAVMRDEQFARAQASRFGHHDDAQDSRDFEESLAEKEKEEQRLDQEAEELERRQIEQHRQNGGSVVERSPLSHQTSPVADDGSPAWHQRARQPFTPNALRKVGPEAIARLRYLADGKQKGDRHDLEGQKSVGDILYGGFADDLEELAPEDRDLLVRYAFQHSALRARRPVVWIPRDKLGVSDDEIRRAKRMSTVTIDSEEKTMIWMSNDGTALDHKGRVVFRKSPPDFSNVDLIAL